MSTTEQTNELAQPAGPTLEAMQEEALKLEIWKNRRELLSDPSTIKLQIGNGQPSEQSITGNQQDSFNGVVVYNPTPATLSVGFQVGSGLLSPATVPPYSWASFPQRYVNLSVALLNVADQQTAIATPVTIVRTRVPPPPGAGSFGGQSFAQSPALTAANPASSVNVAAAGSNNIVAVNGARRELTIVNATATGWVYLALGPAAPALGAGIALEPGGGSYTTTVYSGAVSAIAAVDATPLSIAEV